MDSNESNKDKMDSSNEMEVSDTSIQDKQSEEQLDKISSEKMETEENSKSEVVDDKSFITNKNVKEPTDSQSNEILKINKLQNEPETTEVEKVKDNETSSKVLSTAKDSESSEIDISSLSTTATTNKDTKEAKRKRKSINTPIESSSPVEQNGSANKRKKIETKSDRFCWRCHKESVETQCSACPRSWHRRCMGGAPPLSVTNWICGECASILQAENAETRSPAMAGLSVDQLCMMLRHVVERMRDQHGSEPFWKAVDLDEVPNYLDYVVKPMDLSLLESNVRAKLYGSTDAFMADARWIQHNCIVFNTCGGVYADTSKLTNTAKQMLKVARQEVSEIEACPDCFAHGRNLPRPLPSWFIEPCRKPHPIVWAKLKGFPFWPAKAMPRLNAQGLVDVRFFGEHDRAWVSPKDIYLYSQEPPVALPKKKKLEMEQCVKEVEDHSKKLEEVFGEFCYAPLKVQYDPHDSMQIQLLLPNYDPSTNSRTDVAKREVQSPVNNKVVPPKIEKKPQNSKNTDTSTNGVSECSVDKRKLIRKKRSAESPLQSVNKTSVNVETTVAEKSKSNSPPVILPVNNNNNNNNSDNTEPVKCSGSPEISTAIDISNNSSPKKSIMPIKKVKSDNAKKMKLIRDIVKDDSMKTNVNVKSANGKAVMQLSPTLNNLQNNVEPVKTLVMSGQKPKTLVTQMNMKKQTNLYSNSKLNTKSPQTENKTTNKTLNKVTNKESQKFTINNIQKNNKDNLMSNRTVTTIPVSAKKDQSKAVYHMMNSNASESAKHFNEKETRLNSAVTIIKQEPKDDIQPKLTIPRKQSKARKSFPNKPPSFPQVITPASTYPLSKSNSNTSDAMVYIPPQNNEIRTCSYELPPPEAGPATAQIHRNSKELANRMAQLIADTIKDAAENNGAGTSSIVNHHEATIHYLKLRMEKMKWEHQQEIMELKHNNELVLRELKASMEVERYRALQDARREADIDKLRCIEETKRKQWCVVCGREAMFYCCWNTAYCDYPCQQKHWSSHVATCAQKTSQQQQSPREGSSSSQPMLTSTEPKGQQQNGNNCNEFQTMTTDIL